jgi:uncharacterized protein with NRDE domain
MCVVAVGFETHPRYRLVLAANRDEFHARPSAPIARWNGGDAHIVAGRDLQSGGTWLGVSEQGRVAVVTNIRTGTPPDSEKTSRGALVADYLRGADQPTLMALGDYNAFSLLTVSPEGATLLANRPAPMIEPLPSGVHGLSNGEPHAHWPRKDRLMQAFAECLTSDGDLPEALLTLLASESIDDSIFIRDEIYGTRCSSIVTVDNEGRGEITERSYSVDGLMTSQISISFHFQR